MKYVQHKSGVGNKFKVHAALTHDWHVIEQVCGNSVTHFLPIYEYIEVPAPEVWRDVTAECHDRSSGLNSTLWKYGDEYVATLMNSGKYRLRKVQLREEISYQGMWAFIIEKREEQSS